MMGYRLVILGAGAVGKTSLVGRFLTGYFSLNYRPTVDDIYRHIVRLPDGGFHSIEILDTAGLHQFPAMRQLSIQSGCAFIVVFSIDSRESFLEALQLAELITEIKGTSDIPIMLVGNKCDMSNERQVESEQAENEAKKRNCVYIETSAKCNHNVNDIFMRLLVRVFKVEVKESFQRRLTRKISRKSSSISQKSTNGNNNNNELKRSNSDSDNNNDEEGRCVVM